MKNILILFLFLGFAQEAAFAQIWSKADTGSIPVNPKNRIIKPKKFGCFKLNQGALRSVLQTCVPQGTLAGRDFPTQIGLPMPDGTIQTFRVAESRLMEDGLKKKYPELKSYYGESITDSYATAHFEMNPYFGFTGIIISSKGTIFIDAYQTGNQEYYQSYFTGDYQKSVDEINKFKCQFKNDQNKKVETTNSVVTAAPCIGKKINEYRIAIGCTHQYAKAATNLENPSKEEVLAKIQTTLSRVRAIYIVELGISFVLVSNTDAIIFNTVNGDIEFGPHNDDDDALLAKTLVVIPAFIGLPNYDIGHVFATKTAGLALPGVVCTDLGGLKSGGVSGIANPTGDPFDVDYVAHEIGHQFGADHTFNAESMGGCIDNRNGETAFEPGSGSTIMSYASICGDDNLQLACDPHFHTASYDQVQNYILTKGQCIRTVINITNAIPVITQMEKNGITIPNGTPFILKGLATDSNSTVKYSWEEMDKGGPGSWNSGSNSTDKPLFRSRLPVTEGDRMFPSYGVITAGFPVNPIAEGNGATSLKGETLPTIARSMKFRLTVRDGHGGIATGGSGCSAEFTTDYTIHVSGNGPFAVLPPNLNPFWRGKSCEKIKWNVAGTNLPPINCLKVRILLSDDDGQTFPHVLAEETDNDGEEIITVPFITTPFGRIKVESINNVFFAMSEAPFSITGEYKPELKIETTDQQSCIKNDGKAIISVLNAPIGITYKFSIDGVTFQNSGEFLNLEPGNYFAYITPDDVDCFIKKEFEIKPRDKFLQLTLSGIGTTPFCLSPGQQPSLIVSATASGGSGQYKYMPSTGTITIKGRVEDLPVSFNVTDKLTGCKAVASGKVTLSEGGCSRDPNDIIGPPSFGDAQMVSKFTTWPYKIRFENDPKFASAAAQIVRISMPVDPNLNLFSFRLGDFGFGKFNFTVPPNKTTYSTRLDVMDSLGVVVDVTAGIDLVNRELFWLFESKDPATGLAPNDPGLGFLPVNDSLSKEGEGYVSFTIKPANQTITRDTVHAEANIVFDVNEAILTPQIFNTIDALPPVSQIKPLAQIQPLPTFQIHFSAQEEPKGSGVKAFDVYVSKSNGPFELYEEGITDTSTTFTGVPGTSYGFFTLASDNTGNKEAKKLIGDQSTTIFLEATPPNLGPDQVVSKCEGSPIDLTDNFDFNGLTTTWSTPTPGNQINPGVFSVIATNSSGLKDTAFVVVTNKAAIPAPTISFVGSNSICSGDSTIIQSSSSIGNIWTTGDTTQSLKVKTNGTFNVKTIAAGCTSAISLPIEVVVNPLPAKPIITPNGPVTFCQGGSVSIVTNVAAGHQWSTGSVLNSISVNTTVTVVDTAKALGCKSVSDPITVKVNPLPTVSAGSDVNILAGQTANLTASGADSYLWSPLDSIIPSNGVGATVAVNPIQTTLYSVTGTDTNNCSNTDQVLVTVNTSGQVANPVITPGTGTYTSSQFVTITSATSDATILYTTNGSNPQVGDINTKIYTVPFGLACNTVMKAIATKNGLENSGVTTAILTISSAKPLIPAPISGIKWGVCSSAVRTYSISPVINATSYKWNAPANSIILSGQGSTSVVLQFASGFTAGVLYVQASNCLGTSSAQTIALNRTFISPLSISGPTLEVCAGSTHTYTCPLVEGASGYEWSGPAGTVINSGQGTNTVSITLPTPFASGLLGVKAVSACFQSSVRAISLRSIPTTPTAITGLNAGICVGSEQTFTCPLSTTGATFYNWIAPSGALLKSGQGTNNVTVSFPAGFSSGTISVQAGNACGSYAARNLYLASIPSTPGVITGQSSGICSGGSVTYSIVPVPGATSYQWTVPLNCIITSNTGTTITMLVPNGFIRGSVSVNASNACGIGKVRTLLIYGNTQTPGAITGQASNICAGGSLSYSIAAVPGALTYNWTAPAGCSITSNTGPNITLQVPNNFISGTLSVVAVGPCGNSATRNLILNGLPAMPGAITGQSANLCAGATVTYKIAAVPGATAYTWIVPVSASIISDAGTSITISIPAQFVSDTISVMALGGCGQSAKKKLFLSGFPAAPAAIVGQTANLCGGGTFDYSIPPVSGADSYTWTVPSGCTIVANAGTAVSVSVPSGFVSGLLSVSATNACGVGKLRTVSMTRLPATPSVITGSNANCPSGINLNYGVSNISGLTYSWTVPIGASIVSGQGTNAISATWGGSAGNVGVRASNTCGVSGARSLAVGLLACKENVGENQETKLSASVYPNPGSGEFNLTFNGLDGNVSVRVYNLLGKVVKEAQEMNASSPQTINLKDKASGIYMIHISAKGFDQNIKVVKE